MGRIAFLLFGLILLALTVLIVAPWLAAGLGGCR